MACIARDRKSPFWSAVCSVKVAGKTTQKWRSTKIPVEPLAGRDEKPDGSLPTRKELRTKAEEVARVIERALRSENDGSYFELNLRKILFSDILDSTVGPRLTPYTIGSWLDEWLENRKATVRGRTLTKYKQVFGDFLKSLGPRSSARLDSVSSADFIGFRDSLLKGGRSPQTVNQLVRRVLAAPFNLAWKEGLLPRNPLASISAIPSEHTEKGVFTPEEISALLEVSPVDWRGVILAGYYVGARLQDLANLRWENVELERHLIKFTAQKTRKSLTVPIHPELEEHLLSLPTSDESKAPLFPTLVGKSTGGATGLSMTFKKLMKQAGIRAGLAREGKGEGHSVSLRSFHSLRHSFNSAMANAGVNQETRRKLTGHASDAMNDNYTHFELDVFRQAVELVPRLPKGKRS